MKPIATHCLKVVNFRIFPEQSLKATLDKDRHHLFAVTPHGFFPWGAAMLLVHFWEQGYLPNVAGASVLTKSTRLTVVAPKIAKN